MTWPQGLLLAVAATVMAMGVALAVTGTNIGGLVGPAEGVLFWRSDGRRIRDIATWTAPLALAGQGAAYLPSPAETRLVLIAVLALSAAMILLESFQRRWLSMVAPGVYVPLAPPDRITADAILEIDREFLRALESGRKGRDVRAIESSADRASSEMRALTITERSWEAVRESWLAFANSYRELDPEGGIGPLEEAVARRQRFDALVRSTIAKRARQVTRT